MTDNPLETALVQLTDIQLQAVDWGEGAMLVLAGPGSGKTQVLTCRIARLLDGSQDQSFRVLALTFTNKAADEMKERVAGFVPGLEERANIGTFHSFCGQVLRQHGVHLGIQPDFAIYSQDADRKAVFEDALKRAASDDKSVSVDDTRYLGLIDRIKARLIEPRDAEGRLSRFPDRKRVALAYQAYEEKLRRLNVLDFNSLIFEAHRLMTKFPAIAARYRRSHPYWLLDEFQDTNDAQYRLICAMAGDDFRNVFAVADDDQIIYQWNGASFRQIQRFRADLSAELIQLPTNYRCPPAIVEAANRLVAYNVQRTQTKKPLLASKTNLKLPETEHIQLREFESEEEEAAKIAKEIAARGSGQWGQITVLARTRALLERMQKPFRPRMYRRLLRKGGMIFSRLSSGGLSHVWCRFCARLITGTSAFWSRRLTASPGLKSPWTRLLPMPKRLAKAISASGCGPRAQRPAVHRRTGCLSRSDSLRSIRPRRSKPLTTFSLSLNRLFRRTKRMRIFQKTYRHGVKFPGISRGISGGISHWISSCSSFNSAPRSLPRSPAQ